MSKLGGDRWKLFAKAINIPDAAILVWFRLMDGIVLLMKEEEAVRQPEHEPINTYFGAYLQVGSNSKTNRAADKNKQLLLPPHPWRSGCRKYVWNIITLFKFSYLV